MNEADFLGVPTLELAKAGQFGLLCAAWDLKLVMPESTPKIMQEAMCQGNMHDGVAYVAGLIQPTRADNGKEITAAFHTLPDAPDSREYALKILGQYWLKRVAAGTDAEVAYVLAAADVAHARLDYPADPFSTMCYFHDMSQWDGDNEPPLPNAMQRAREWASEYLAGDTSDP
ncbi:MAG: hypothetical protein KDB68_08105 [Planctomycetes bacterium]|nr:hypothetical protein [Planctomycetota bacterium]